MTLAKRSVRVRITGLVQGVGYRAWTARTAQGLGLAGWVRNRADGSVEAVLAGDESAVRAMLEACRSGPPSARVARVEEADEPGSVPRGFAQLPTV